MTLYFLIWKHDSTTDGWRQYHAFACRFFPPSCGIWQNAILKIQFNIWQSCLKANQNSGFLDVTNYIKASYHNTTGRDALRNKYPCLYLSALQPERRQTENPQWVAVSPGPRNYSAAFSRHRGGQASFLQTVRRLCFRVSVL